MRGRFSCALTVGFVRGKGNTLKGAVIGNTTVQRFGDTPQRYIEGAVLRIATTGKLMFFAVDPGSAAAQIKGGVCVAADIGAQLGRVPCDPGASKQLKELSDGDICSAVFQIAGYRHIPVIVMYIDCSSVLGTTYGCERKGNGQRCREKSFFHGSSSLCCHHNGCSRGKTTHNIFHLDEKLQNSNKKNCPQIPCFQGVRAVLLKRHTW